MLSLHPSLLLCGLVQLLTLNQTISVHDALVFARVGTLVTVATRATDLSQYIGLQLRTNLRPLPSAFLIDAPPTVEIRTPTDLILYTAPIGAYTWYTSPALRQTVYGAIAETRSSAIRLRNTVSNVLRRRPRRVPQPRHSPAPALYASHPPASTGIRLVSLNDFIRLSDESKATGVPIHLIPLHRPLFGPRIGSLQRFLLRSDVSVYSGLDFCGFGTAPPSTPPVSVAPSALPANMSSLPGLMWCGVGAEMLAQDSSLPAIVPTLGPDMSTTSGLGYCGLGTASTVPVLAPVSGPLMSALSWRGLRTEPSVKVSMPVYTPGLEFATPMCSLVLSDACQSSFGDSCAVLLGLVIAWRVYVFVKVALTAFIRCAWLCVVTAHRLELYLLGVLRRAFRRAVRRVIYAAGMGHTAYLGVTDICASVLARSFMWVWWALSVPASVWRKLWPDKSSAPALKAPTTWVDNGKKLGRKDRKRKRSA
ncbi:hypothetical protein BDV93DRAFT_507342 [Ceratobasidium sp. AG-I]|nr:hypothetical protein BDV93DRAFT_507342 [Ceratobasidium sp. AG-I]